MMMRRRRPLMRAAMVGGAAYHVGKRNAQNQAADAEQEARIEDLEAQAQAPQAPPAPAAGSLTDNTIEQLQKLSQLKEAGVLTQEEFDSQKQKLLAAS